MHSCCDTVNIIKSYVKAWHFTKERKVRVLILPKSGHSVKMGFGFWGFRCYFQKMWSWKVIITNKKGHHPNVRYYECRILDVQNLTTYPGCSWTYYRVQDWIAGASIFIRWWLLQCFGYKRTKFFGGLRQVENALVAYSLQHYRYKKAVARVYALKR